MVEGNTLLRSPIAFRTGPSRIFSLFMRCNTYSFHIHDPFIYSPNILACIRPLLIMSGLEWVLICVVRREFYM